MMPPKNYTHTNFENKLHNSIRDEKKSLSWPQQQKNTLLHIYGETKKIYTRMKKKKESEIDF